MNNAKLVSASCIRRIVRLIDLTNLNDDCDRAAIEALCHQGDTAVGKVAAVCVWPDFVQTARNSLGENSPIKIATVVNFPSGNESLETTCASIEKVLAAGANEIDYVLPYSELIQGNSHRVNSSLAVVRREIPQDKTLKVILETGELNSGDLILTAAKLAIDNGADFIKTSTGKVPVNATINAATTMLQAIAQLNKDVGFKAAGGIKTIADANLYLDLAIDLLGESWVNSKHFRFGASGLLHDALARLNIDSASNQQHEY